MADYTVWHIVRELNRRYPLGDIKTIEDISGNIFELTNVDACTIIEWHKEARVTILIEAGDEVRREVQRYFSQNTRMNIVISVERKRISLPLNPLAPLSQPQLPKRNKDRYQLLKKKTK